MSAAGRYRVVRRIGSGGMAEVLEGVALGEDGRERRVAIKRILDAHRGDEAVLRRFLGEARLASQLRHAGIVAMLDLGVVDGLPFQVLEYVDGVEGSALVGLGEPGGRAFPVELALHVCAEVARALAYAHAALDPAGRPLGLVHRDVKPGNILVAWDGDVKLADFGIASARDQAGRLAGDAAGGTLLYTAPEGHARGAVDGRADVFGLGCTLHALVVGESPLAGEGRLMRFLAGGEAEPSPELPRDVGEIVARATARDPAARHASAGELAAALDRALARRTDEDGRILLARWLEAVRPPAGARLAPPDRRDPWRGVDLVLLADRDPIAPGARRFEARRPRSPAGSPARPPARPAALVAALLAAGALAAALVWALLARR